MSMRHDVDPSYQSGGEPSPAHIFSMISNLQSHMSHELESEQHVFFLKCSYIGYYQQHLAVYRISSNLRGASYGVYICGSRWSSRAVPRFSLEQRMYTSEGINWSHITWQERPVSWIPMLPVTIVVGNQPVSTRLLFGEGQGMIRLAWYQESTKLKPSTSPNISVSPASPRHRQLIGSEARSQNSIVFFFLSFITLSI